MLRNQKRKVMEQFISTPNSILIQGATMSDLESMLSRLLDKKLADIIDSTLKVDVSPKDGLYKRKVAAEKLQISLVTLDNWTKLGIINARKVGSRVYYTDSDINNALKRYLNPKDMGKLDINITQTQQIVMGFISPIIDEIVDRVSERVLAASKKEPKFYTRKEAAEILHVTLPTLARITKDGLLISKRVGSRILYEADAIDEAVKKQVVFKYRRA